MPNLVALKAEILLPAYNGMTDAQIAAAINAATYQVSQNINSVAAMNELLFTVAGDWGNIVSIADGVTTAGVSAANRIRAISIKELFTRNNEFRSTDDTRWTRFISVVDTLITGGHMSAEGKTALVALRTRTLPLWRKFGERELDFNDIVQARAV